MHTTATKTTIHTDDTHVRAEPSGPVVKASPAQLPLWAQTGLPLQTRLTINQPGDKYEQEADHVAEQVMRMSNPQVQCKPCSCGKPAGPDGMCAECKKKELGVQRLESGNMPPTTAPPIVPQVLQQPGRPLDGATRNFMASRFGRDFGHVRVHTGTKAAESARAVNARAYTAGQHIVFGAGQYAPGINSGQNLLAHELTHVVQQGSDGYLDAGNIVGRSFLIQRQSLWESAKSDLASLTSGIGSITEAMGIDPSDVVAQANTPLSSIQLLERLRDVPVVGTNLFQQLNVSDKVAKLLDLDSEQIRMMNEALDDPARFVDQSLKKLEPYAAKVEGEARKQAQKLAENNGRVLSALGQQLGQFPSQWRPMLKDMILSQFSLKYAWNQLWKDLEQIYQDNKNGKYDDSYEYWLHIAQALLDALDGVMGILEMALLLVGLLSGAVTGAIALGTAAGLGGGAVSAGTAAAPSAAVGGGTGSLGGGAAGGGIGTVAYEVLGAISIAKSIAIEGAYIADAYKDLIFKEQTSEQEDTDYQQIASSLIALGTMLGFALLGSLAARLGKRMKESLLAAAKKALSGSPLASAISGPVRARTKLGESASTPSPAARKSAPVPTSDTPRATDAPGATDAPATETEVTPSVPNKVADEGEAIPSRMLPDAETVSSEELNRRAVAEVPSVETGHEWMMDENGMFYRCSDPFCTSLRLQHGEFLRQQENRALLRELEGLEAQSNNNLANPDEEQRIHEGVNILKNISELETKILTARQVSTEPPVSVPGSAVDVLREMRLERQRATLPSSSQSNLTDKTLTQTGVMPPSELVGVGPDFPSIPQRSQLEGPSIQAEKPLLVLEKHKAISERDLEVDELLGGTTALVLWKPPPQSPLPPSTSAFRPIENELTEGGDIPTPQSLSPAEPASSIEASFQKLRAVRQEEVSSFIRRNTGLIPALERLHGALPEDRFIAVVQFFAKQQVVERQQFLRIITDLDIGPTDLEQIANRIGARARAVDSVGGQFTEGMYDYLAKRAIRSQDDKDEVLEALNRLHYSQRHAAWRRIDAAIPETQGPGEAARSIPLAVADLPPESQTRLGTELAHRTAEQQSFQQMKAASTLDAELREQVALTGLVSEQLGELGAQEAIRNKYPTALRVYYQSEGSGVFDQLWYFDNPDGTKTWLIGEAKGAGGKPSARKIGQQWYEQGTIEHTRDTLRSMAAKAKNDPGLDLWVRVVEAALDKKSNDKVIFVKVTTPVVQSVGQPALGNLLIEEWDLP